MADKSTNLTYFREKIRNSYLANENNSLKYLIENHAPDNAKRQKITERAISLVNSIRNDSKPSIMEVFLAEYGLSTDEGVALMCLAEALLRVPDDETIDALIADKIVPSAWGEHLGKSSSSLVNASTWALLLTGSVLNEKSSASLGAVLKKAIRRVGEPVIRTAVHRAMQEMGEQFVLGRTIEEAMKRASKEKENYTHSYDMLGEAACTEGDAKRYHIAYGEAITIMAKQCESSDIRKNPGISIKLSALHPRYEFAKKDRVMRELVPRARSLALLAKSGGMGLNIDAEEADRLDISLDVIEAILSDPSLAGWDGFGVVVQAYGPRASYVIDWLYALSKKFDRKIMVRLVKGAYWDTEIKRAQTLGLDGFPVFSRKNSTDVSYICCASKLLKMTDRIYPQFATHNAQTVAAILEMATDYSAFEFQRLHGMGESLHETVIKNSATQCRIYAPVGTHRDLLAYLVRRLLENGANSSFVNQIVDKTVSPEIVAADPFKKIATYIETASNPNIAQPPVLFGESRKNAKGWDHLDDNTLVEIEKQRKPYKKHQWHAAPIIACDYKTGTRKKIHNPADPADLVGTVQEGTKEQTTKAIQSAKNWFTTPANKRAEILNKAADLFEKNHGEVFSLLSRESGKTIADAISELREAVDFMRYYAHEAKSYAGTKPRGIISCISPWNFPLAIFSGQVCAALAAGNGVIAKPADQTPLIAMLAVKFLHQAGVPTDVLQLIPGKGIIVGAELTSNKKINGVCFTGSTATALNINRSMAQNLDPDASLIAETGGLNAMIIDSTALPEQAVRDIVMSAFQSAGQRCSALRVLYLQKDIAKPILKMLFGAMDELSLGNPWTLNNDIGPIIDEAARIKIKNHIDKARNAGKLLYDGKTPKTGTFIAPSAIEISGIGDLSEEIFGPILHIATYEAKDLDTILEDINMTGYGLTFGLHTRIDNRVQYIVDRLHVGNIYINRNQIGAIVGSQPFGGEGLSGTGPKAGGPHYLPRFLAPKTAATTLNIQQNATTAKITARNLNEKISNLKTPTSKKNTALSLPGPTGESNQLSLHPRGLILCLGPTAELAQEQYNIAISTGCTAIAIAPGISPTYGINGILNPEELSAANQISAVVYWGEANEKRKIRLALAKQNGALISLINEKDFAHRCYIERHICIDTTASGGNASLLAATDM